MGYNDINRGPELMEAYTKLQQWRAQSKAAKATDYQAVAKTTRVKIDRVPGFVLPFDGKAGVYVECRQIKSTQSGAGSATANIVRGLVDDRILEELTATDASFKGENFKFARIILSARTDTVTTNTPSRKTGIPYKRHRSDNVSSPFGAKAATESYTTAVNLIKANAAYNQFLTTLGNRVSFDPQG